MTRFPYIESKIISIMENSLSGKSLATISNLVGCSKETLLTFCEEYLKIKEHDTSMLTDKQMEEFFNRCRPGLFRRFKEMSQVAPISFGGQPIRFAEVREKPLMQLSKRMHDPYLRPQLKSKKVVKKEKPKLPQQPVRKGPFDAEKETILRYKRFHPLAIFPFYQDCFACASRRNMMCNQCPHFAGVYPYKGLNYAACLRKEHDSEMLPPF